MVFGICRGGSSCNTDSTKKKQIQFSKIFKYKHKSARNRKTIVLVNHLHSIHSTQYTHIAKYFFFFFSKLFILLMRIVYRRKHVSISISMEALTYAHYHLFFSQFSFSFSCWLMQEQCAQATNITIFHDCRSADTSTFKICTTMHIIEN